MFGDYDDDMDGIGDEYDLDGLGDMLYRDDYELGELAGKGNKKAKAALKIKKTAKKHGVSKQKAAKALRKQAKRRAKKEGRFGMSSGSIACPTEPGCPVLAPINQPLYDTERLTTTHSTDITYFSTILGQATTVSGSSITKGTYHTNMNTPKGLPSPQRYEMRGLTVDLPRCPVDSLNDLNENCSVEFYLGSSVHVTVPFSLIPMYAPTQGSFDGTTGQTPANIAWRNSPEWCLDLRAYNHKTKGLELLRINKQETFSVKLKFNAALTLAAALDVRFIFHGILWREVR